MADQSRLHLRLFLEGLEVSVIDATVNATVGAPAQATIQIVYTPEVVELLPRTLVHLFFYDDTPTSEGEYYRLLFCGDLTTVSITKTETNRTATLVCSDHKEYYNYAFLHLLNTEDLSGSNAVQALLRNRQLFSQAGSTTIVSGAQTIESVISRIFEDGRPTYIGYTNLRGALGGLIKAMEMFTGLSSSGAGGVNAFYAYNVARLNLLGQIGMFPNDYTSQKILLSKELKALLTQKGEQLGDLISLNALIDFILGFIYHRSVPNPCAFYKPREMRDDFSIDLSSKDLKKFRSACTLNKDLISSTLEELKVGRVAGEANRGEDKIISDDRVGNSIINAVTFMFPTEVLEDLLSRPYRPSSRVVSLIKSTLTKASALELSEMPFPPKSTVKTMLVESSNAKDPALLRKVGEYLNHLLSSAEQVAIDQAAGNPPRNNDYIATLEKAVTLVKSMAEDQDLKYSSLSTPRLYTSLVVPDLFFSVAPKCNVVFPDQYFTSSYTRNVSKEVTRLQLERMDAVTNASVASRYYYAPATESISGLQGEALKDSDTALTKDLMGHELYSGIIPEFTSVMNLELQTLGLGNTAEDEKSFYSTIANYRFLQQRLSHRQLSVSGKFNPYAATGFPMVVVDTPDPQSNHYIGLLTGLTHSVTQQGGTTSYQLQYARPHTSRDDTFANDFGVKTVVSRGEESILISRSSLINDLATRYMSGRDYSSLLNALKFMSEKCSDVIGGQGNYLKGDEFSKDEFYDDIIDGVLIPREMLSGLDIKTKLPVDTIKSISRSDILPLGGPHFRWLIKGKGSNNLSLKEITDDLAKRYCSPRPSQGSKSKRLNAPQVYNEIRDYLIVPLISDMYEYVNQLPSNLREQATKDAAQINVKILSSWRSLRPSRLYRDEGELQDEIDTISVQLAEFITEVGKSLLKLDDSILALYLMASASVPHRALLNIIEGVSVDIVTSSTKFIPYPIEESMRPGFLHPAYSSPNIGTAVYKDLLGVGSVIDEVALTDVPEEAVFSIDITQEDGTVETDLSVSQQYAVEVIVSRYASSNYGPEFVDSFTRRPIATLREVLMDKDKGFHYKAFAEEVTEDKEIPFMGNAFKVEDGEPLPDNVRVLSASEQQALKDDKVDDRVDVRTARSKAVKKYIYSLQNRGLRG